MKKNHLSFVLLALAFWVAANNTQAEPSAKKTSSVSSSDAVATVNGVEIKKSEIENILTGLSRNGVMVTPEVKNQVLKEMIVSEVVLAEAARRGLDKKSEFKLQLEELRRRLLIESLWNDAFAKNAVSEAELHDEYEKQKQALGESDTILQYQLDQIVVPNEKAALDVIAKVKAGEAFDKLAATLSIDEATKAKGGKVGWVLAKELVPVFANVVTNLPKGSVTMAPIQSGDGWHVMKVEDTRPFKIPGFEDSRQQLTLSVQNQRKQKMVEELVKKSNVKLN